MTHIRKLLYIIITKMIIEQENNEMFDELVKRLDASLRTNHGHRINNKYWSRS